jgi:hypothetical protein
MRIRTYNKPALPDVKINKIANNLRKVYAFLIALGALYASMFMIYSLMDKSYFETKHVYNWESFVSLLIYISIYFGLKKRSHWVIHLVLICSAFSIFVIFISILSPAESIAMLVGKVINVMLLFFFIYQINFFRRKEVKTFFSTSGVEFFQ